MQNNPENEFSHFQIESGSFETLIKLADEGLGTTLLPYLHTLDLKESDKIKLRHFAEPNQLEKLA
jgi:LysR family hydrogen peroxide-inducible transcriptional activator